MGFWYFLGFVIAIVIDWTVAKEFASIADDKGYREGRYFWFCFFLGIVGYLMVIALPDLGSRPTRPHVNHTPTPSPAPTSTPTVSAGYTGKTGGTADAIVGLHSIRCTRCEKWQSKDNTVCVQCGATFTKFIEK